MKTLVAVVLLTLICIVHRSAGLDAANLLMSNGCCTVYSPVRVPKGRIKNVVMTPSSCASKAIVVTTVCKKEVCVKLELDWARKVLEEFQNSTANNTSPSAPFNVFKCNEKKKSP
ncbi:C-C motif chemokine 2 [Channa argus]|uniref:C-C motif chemokine 2 n=1 Tax=Channa argus TaxID=215402 RepID=A0A6G1P901_CHAAH|nr:C-C motif chemokine 2 [Channa argus]